MKNMLLATSRTVLTETEQWIRGILEACKHTRKCKNMLI